MPIRVAVNGFGRIGRLVTRIAKIRQHFDLVAVNDLGAGESLAHLFKYDSVHGTFPGRVRFEPNEMWIDDDHFQVLRESDPANLPWRELGVDYVIEASGVFRKRAQLEKHLEAGAKAVILTVPAKDEIDATIVLGVNENDLIPSCEIVSVASCTTNCVAPVIRVLDETFGVVDGTLNTIHAYTNDQALQDQPHKDLRRARAAATSIIPTTTGAGKALGEIFPELAGKIHSMAMRVPVPDGSVIDLVVHTKKPVTKDVVNEAFRQRAAGDLNSVLEYTEDPIVSCDIIGNPHSAIVDGLLTSCAGQNVVRVCAWYDNEWAYSNRVVDVVERMAAQNGIAVDFTPKGNAHTQSFRTDHQK